MGISHKAYAFDWEPFEKRVRPLLEAALSSHNPEALLALIERQLGAFADPYEGAPLEQGWRARLERGDEHEVGDYALTLCYRPTEDFGVGDQWLEMESVLSDGAKKALLGRPIGPPDNLFDPGKMGSYFQSPEQCRASLSIIESECDKVPAEFLDGLRQTRRLDKGLYVTF